MIVVAGKLDVWKIDVSRLTYGIALRLIGSAASHHDASFAQLYDPSLIYADVPGCAWMCLV